MKKILFILFLLGATFFSKAQPGDRDYAMQLVSKNSVAIGLPGDQVSNAIVSSTYFDKSSGMQMVYLIQSYKGLPVYNQMLILAFKNDKPVSQSGKFIAGIEKATNAESAIPKVMAENAVRAAMMEIKSPIPASLKAAVDLDNGRKINFGKTEGYSENIIAELMWVPVEKGNSNTSYKLAWQVQLYLSQKSDYWNVQVDAEDNSVINKINLTVNCSWDVKLENYTESLVDKYAQQNQSVPLATPPPSVSSAGYRVIPYPIESPAYGSFSLVNDPWLLAGAGNASGSLGWHNDGTTEYNTTRGNNVWAKDDVAGDNETTIGISATSSTAAPNYTFDFLFNPGISPKTAPNQSAAISNLFYWNNIVHDITYQYGFDEAAGNFQNNNQGRGGTGADYVLADAQDGSGSNNANFGTPVDGSRPRMQMFLFSPAPSTILKVNSTPVAIPAMNAYEFVMSANNKLANVGPVTGDVVLYDNGANTGCSAAAANAFTGKIVLVIYNGACDPNVATKNAQNAGAIGLVMQMPSNIPANTYLVTTNNTVTIPSVDINFADGNALKNAMLSGTVNLTLSGINLDGDFDNGVIVHEYGHGISNRLTGGPANSSCLQNAEQMGEGWSDYYALMMTTNWASATVSDGPNKRPIGNYVLGQSPTGAGIRTYPYSTNMTINPWTYSMLATNTNSGEVHLVGEIWAATLWDMTWNIIATDGINSNLYNASGAGGNSVAMKLVTQGLKLQPCSPGFIQGRDAILQADQLLYGGAHYCAIWNAFARRGMGFSALQGSSNSITDQTAAFDLPPAKTITASANPNGSISDPGVTTLGCGVSKTYTITPNSGYAIQDVLVDAVSQGAIATYTFNNVIANHTISASFSLACALTGTATTTATTCSNPNSGSITVTLSDGTSGTYSLDGGAATPFASNPFTISGVTAGPHTVIATNSLGCVSSSISATVGATAALTVTLVKTNLSACNAVPDGTITLTPAGGVGPYLYTWSGETGSNHTPFTAGNVSSLTGLNYGYYNVTITDQGGCGSVTYTNIHVEFAYLVYITNSGSSSSACGNTGSILLYGNSGITPYTYALSPGAGPAGTFQPGNAFTGLASGSYTAYVKDAGGCVSSKPVTVSAAPAITVNPFVRNASSCGSDGSIEVYRTGGIPPYTYSKDGTNYQAGNVFSGLAAATYTVYVKDAAGCINSASATVNAGVGLSVTISKVNTSSCLNDGSIQVNATGGVAPYMFSFNGATYQSSNSLAGLGAGPNTVQVKDFKGCLSALTNVTINLNTIVVTASVVNASSCVSSNGSILLFRTGGYGPYSYSLDGNTYQSSNSFTNKAAGSYTGYVKDSKGCIGALAGIVVGPDCPPGPIATRGSNTNGHAAKSIVNNSFFADVYPNPSTTEFTLVLKADNKEKVFITVTDILGKKMVQLEGNSGKQYKFGKDLIPGMYILEVVQGGNKESIKLVKQ